MLSVRSPKENGWLRFFSGNSTGVFSRCDLYTANIISKAARPSPIKSGLYLDIITDFAGKTNGMFVLKQT